MIFTTKKLHNHINNFLIDLKENKITVKKAILFGSYANGKIHKNSDIDIALWADEFIENDDNLTKIKSVVSKYRPINPILYNTNEKDDPFIEVITKTGKTITT